MSYSYSAQIPKSGGTADLAALDEAKQQQLAALDCDGCDNPVEETRDHVAAIDRAVELLAEVIGGDDEQLAVNVSGHANRGHAPQEGWADEVITLTVRRVPAEPTS